MGTPQIIMIAMYGLSIGIAMAKHGEQRKDKYNVWSAIIGSSIGCAILWWGGFWS